MNGFKHGDLLDRLRAGLQKADLEYAVSIKHLVLHAHPYTLRALSGQNPTQPAWLTPTTIEGVPVKADRNLEPSRLVLRYEVEC